MMTAFVGGSGRESDLPSGPPSSRTLTLRYRAYRPSHGWSRADGAGAAFFYQRAFKLRSELQCELIVRVIVNCWA